MHARANCTQVEIGNFHSGLLVALLVLFATAPLPAADKAETEKEEGFVSLFNGRNLDGWTGATDGYKVEDGALICIPEKGGNLFTESEYGDFIVRFDFKLTPGGNNGLAIRSPLKGHIATEGIEVQILDDTAPKHANIKPWQFHGSVYGIVPAKPGYLKPVGEWNSEEVTASGRHVKVVLNGVTIVDANLDAASTPKTIDDHEHPGMKRDRGHLGFLGHGTRVEMRNIRVKDTTFPPFPRVSLAPAYRVDAGWPQRPEGTDLKDVSGVAVDDKDQVWVYTRADPPIQVYDASGKLLRTWGTGVLNKAHHIKIDHEGKIWVADIGLHAVMQFTPEGQRLRVLGTPGERGEGEYTLDKPTDMAVTKNGDVFISDGYGNNRIVHYDKRGNFVKSWGKLGTGPGEFSLPHAIAMDSQGLLYVADRNNVRVQIFDQAGKFISEWRDRLVPWGFWVGKNDEIWVCGSSPMPWRSTDKVLGVPPKDQLFMKFNTKGEMQQLWTVPKGADGQERPGELNWVHAIALDSQGNIYAGDIIGKRVQKFVPQP